MQSISLVCLSLVVTCSVLEVNALIKLGRHVCVQRKEIQHPTPRTQTYCRPVYQKQYHLCATNRICTSYRLVYQRSIRRVYSMELKIQETAACCPGWTQRDPADSGCMTPICENACENNGTCTQPERCSCRLGFNGKRCGKDVNECRSKLNICHQRCINFAGSYHCACFDGFTLQPDGISCHLCLSCITEYKELQDNYRFLKGRVLEIEEEKETMQKMIQSYVNTTLEQINNITTSLLPTTSGLAYSGHPGGSLPLDQLMSLSEQISMLEERLDVCTCRKEDYPINSGEDYSDAY